MLRNRITPGLAALLLGTVAAAQEAVLPTTLQRARATFAAVDLDDDQSLTFAELQRVGLSPLSFREFDADHGDSWSEADFLLYYAHLHGVTERPVAQDLLVEVQRIRTRRRQAEGRSPGSAAERAPRPTQQPEEVDMSAARGIVPQTAPTPVAGETEPAVAPPTESAPANGAAAPRANSTGAAPERADDGREAYEQGVADREAAREDAKRRAREKAANRTQEPPRNLLERAQRAQRDREDGAETQDTELTDPTPNAGDGRVDAGRAKPSGGNTSKP